MQYSGQPPPSVPTWLAVILSIFVSLAITPHAYNATYQFVLFDVFGSGYEFSTARFFTDCYWFMLYPLVFVLCMVLFREVTKFLYIWFYTKLF